MFWLIIILILFIILYNLDTPLFVATLSAIVVGPISFVLINHFKKIYDEGKQAEKEAVRRALESDGAEQAEEAAETTAPTTAAPAETPAPQEEAPQAETPRKEAPKEEAPRKDEKPILNPHIVTPTDYVLLYRKFDKFADKDEDEEVYDEIDAEFRYYMGDEDEDEDYDDDFAYSNTPTEPLLTQEQFEALGSFVKEGMGICDKLSKRKDFFDSFEKEMFDIDSVGLFNPIILQHTLYTYLASDLFKVLGNFGLNNDIEDYATFGKEPTIDCEELEGQIFGVLASFLTASKEPAYTDYCNEMRMKHAKGRPSPYDMREEKARALRFFHTVGNSVLPSDVFEFNMPILLAYFKQDDLLPTMRKLIYDFTLFYAATRERIEPHKQKYIDKLKRQWEEAAAAVQPPAPAPEEALEETPAAAQTEKQEPASLSEEVDPQEQLRELIGLGEVKKEIQTLSEFITVNQKREAQGLKVAPLSYHCVFVGNPGTGKTTVARILSGIYRQLGVLKEGQLVETDRSGLVGEYVGQTAVKTNKIIDKALDGVLFIDEAYTLVQGNQNDYGREAIATLLKRMEDDRDRLVVVLAGYNDEMEAFLQSNPGLRSRFNRYIHFEDYAPEELQEIFKLQLKKFDYTLAPDAEDCLRQLLEATWQGRAKDFGNARFVRNFFEKTIEVQALRLSESNDVTAEELQRIHAEDLRTAHSQTVQA